MPARSSDVRLSAHAAPRAEHRSRGGVDVFGDSDDAITSRRGRVAAALNVIAAALRSQEQELAQLRTQSAAFAKLRQLLQK